MYLSTVAPLIGVIAGPALLAIALWRANINSRDPQTTPAEQRLYRRLLPATAISDAIVTTLPTNHFVYALMTALNLIIMVKSLGTDRSDKPFDHFEAGNEATVAFLLFTLAMWFGHGILTAQSPIANLVLMIMVIPAFLSAFAIIWSLVGLMLRPRSCHGTS